MRQSPPLPWAGPGSRRPGTLGLLFSSDNFLKRQIVKIQATVSGCFSCTCGPGTVWVWSPMKRLLLARADPEQQFHAVQRNQASDQSSLFPTCWETSVSFTDLMVAGPDLLM